MIERITFVGPSLFGQTWRWENVERRPPVEFGDVYRAVRHGAKVVGIIDGHYESVPSVWHKEILFALDEGVQVIGGASMGALRAAECAAFGMVPIGQVAAGYQDGTYQDDGDVAVITAPREMHFRPLTEALVDMRATFDVLLKCGDISSADHNRLVEEAALTFFKRRTPAKVVAAALPSAKHADVLRAYSEKRTSIKQADAIAVVNAVADATLPQRPRPFGFAASPFWLQAVSRLDG